MAAWGISNATETLMPKRTLCPERLGLNGPLSILGGHLGFFGAVSLKKSHPLDRFAQHDLVWDCCLAENFPSAEQASVH